MPQARGQVGWRRAIYFLEAASPHERGLLVLFNLHAGWQCGLLQLADMFFCLQEKSSPSYASLPAAVVQPEEPALESELDKRGLADQFVSMLMAAESPEHVSYLNSAFKSLVGAAQEVQQEAEEAQEVHSDAEDTAE